MVVLSKFDVKKIKKKLTLSHYDMIMRALNIPLYKKTDSYWQYWTGDKNKDAFTGSPKLYFYCGTKTFMSYTAGCSYDIFSLTQKRLGLLGEDDSFIASVKFVLGICDIEDNLDELSPKEITKNKYDWHGDLDKFVRFRKTGSSLKTYDTAVLDKLLFCPPIQWLSEGIKKNTLEKYQIGYYDRLNQTTIPVFGKSGELYGIRCRNWNEEAIKNAKYIPLTTLNGDTYKFSTNDVLYGYSYNWLQIQNTGTVYIGESEKFVLKMDTFFGESSCAVGMFGNNLGLKRRNQLIKLGVNRVIYVPDNDWIGKDEKEFEIWKSKVLKWCEQWKGFASVELVWDNMELLNPKENATDRTLEVFQILYDNREIILE